MKLVGGAAVVLAIAVLAGSGATQATTLVERVDGHACVVAPVFYWWGDADSGPVLDDNPGDASTIICPIPVGPSTVTLADLGHINVRGRITGHVGEDVDIWLWAHDFASTDYCQCDSDTYASTSDGAYWLLTAYYGGPGGHCDDYDCPGEPPGGAEPASDWLVTLSIELSDHQGYDNKISIKAISVYSEL